MFSRAFIIPNIETWRGQRHSVKIIFDLDDGRMLWSIASRGAIGDGAWWAAFGLFINAAIDSGALDGHTFQRTDPVRWCWRTGQSGASDLYMEVADHSRPLDNQLPRRVSLGLHVSCFGNVNEPGSCGFAADLLDFAVMSGEVAGFTVENGFYRFDPADADYQGEILVLAPRNITQETGWFVPPELPELTEASSAPTAAELVSSATAANEEPRPRRRRHCAGNTPALTAESAADVMLAAERPIVGLGNPTDDQVGWVACGSADDEDEDEDDNNE
ncbi:MAG: hypothetical protein LBM73_00425 [Candidatus Nomurabacteria bacterium]|jgi:hypothetical protein|nr:hypothetical protein [Candidatus Nomurabacteria bacterium]